MNRVFQVLRPRKIGWRMLAPLAALLVGAAPALAQPSSPSGVVQEHMVLDGPDFPPFDPVTNPIGHWHELWPDFCTPWECIDWIDNSNGFLDFCDYIRLETPDQPEPTWWHVENVTLTVHFDEVQGPFPPPVYAEWTGPLPPDPQDFLPFGDWHMIYPDEIYCQTWFCFDWQDTNGNGIVDFCDWLFFENTPFGDVVMHVAGTATDIEVIREDPPQPDHMVLDGPDFPPFEPIPDPRGPWHELWPVYCTPWNIIDWVDNSNGFLDFCDYVQIANANEPPTWWHVENVTVTVMFDSAPPPYQDPIYLEWTGPLPPNADEFDPIGVWHEVYPDYCFLWHCDFWEDTNLNGIVDFCDWFFFTDPDGEVVMMHVAGVATDIEVIREEPPPTSMVLDGPDFPPFDPVTDPLGPWHELWPTFCTQWTAIDWIDNDSGVLDHCDYILLETPDEPEPTWWHVDYVTLTVLFDEIQGPYAPPIYMEWTGTVPHDPMQFDPLGPWHEVYPNYCIVWECVEWHDTNESGVLDFCDWLCFEDPFTGDLVCMHVGVLATDIRVVREDPPPPPTMILDGPDFPPFEPIPDPRGPWHELWPIFCTPWECVDWIDNGNQFLDFCDYMKLGVAGGEPTWWHVENVTLTVQFDQVDGPFPPPAYAEWLEPLPPDPHDFLPIGPWHMIYPEEIYCQTWECVGWQDNGNGILDFCDWLCFIDPNTGLEVCMHVFELATDIEVIEERPPCPADFDGDWVVGFQDLLQLLAQWGPCTVDPCPWDLTADNEVGFQDLLILLAAWGPCP